MLFDVLECREWAWATLCSTFSWTGATSSRQPPVNGAVSGSGKLTMATETSLIGCVKGKRELTEI